MFAWIWAKLSEGYNSSAIGGNLTRFQKWARRSWNESFAGKQLAGAGVCVEESMLFGWVSKLRFPKFLPNSVLPSFLTQYEFFSLLLLFFAPLAPTMVCIAGALLILFGFLARECAMDSEDEKPFPAAINFCVFLFLTATFIFSVTSVEVIGSLKVWAVYAVFISIFFPIAKAARQKESRLFCAASSLVCGGTVVALYGVAQQFFGNNLGLGHAWIDEEMFTGIAVRVYSTLGNPNVLGEYLLLVIPVSVGLAWSCIKQKRAWLSLLFAGCAGLQMLCMVFTQSRGCWLALVFTALIFVILVDKRFVALFILGAIAAPYLLPASIIERLMSIGNLSDSSTSYRVFIWLGTLNMLNDFWLFGIGLGAAAWAKIYPFYSYSMIVAPHAHNIYLQVMAEMGIVGLIALLSVVAVFCACILRSYVNSKEKTFPIILGAACLSGVLGFMMQGAFDYVWYNYRVFLVFWIVLGLGIASATLTKSTEAAPTPRSTTRIKNAKLRNKKGE